MGGHPPHERRLSVRLRLRKFPDRYVRRLIQEHDRKPTHLPVNRSYDRYSKHLSRPVQHCAVLFRHSSTPTLMLVRMFSFDAGHSITHSSVPRLIATLLVQTQAGLAGTLGTVARTVMLTWFMCFSRVYSKLVGAFMCTCALPLPFIALGMVTKSCATLSLACSLWSVSRRTAEPPVIHTSTMQAGGVVEVCGPPFHDDLAKCASSVLAGRPCVSTRRAASGNVLVPSFAGQ